MKITDFVKLESQEKKLKKVREASSKEEKREVEQKLLLPEEVPPYTKDTPTSKSEVEEKTVTLVFGSINDIELLKKFFKISEYKAKNIRAKNLNLLIDFLKALEKGEIKYNAEKRVFKYHKGSDEMGERESGSEIKRKHRKLH